MTGHRPGYGGCRTGTGYGGCRTGTAVPGDGCGGDQPISSSALPLVSFTNLSTKGIESVAKKA